MYYTYSWRAGGHEPERLDPDEVIEALADRLLADGDPSAALQHAIRAGLRPPGGPSVMGTGALVQHVRERRRAELERYNLDSMTQDLRERIAEIVRTERAEIERRLDEADGPDGAASGEERQALEAIASRKTATLDGVPPEPGPAVTALADYEFLSDLARAEFDALLDLLQRQVLQARFRTMQESVRGLTPEAIGELTAAVRALNQLIEGRDSADRLDFERFRAQHGAHFPGSADLPDLLQQLSVQAAQTEALLAGMAPEERQTLEQSMSFAVRDPRLRDEMARLHALMEPLVASHPPAARYPFSGRQSLTLEEALGLMRRMERLDVLEAQLRAVHTPSDVSAIDWEAARDLVSDEAHASLRALQSLVPALEEAGYLERQGSALRLTARGIRRIGQKALLDIFRGVERSGIGDHTVKTGGAGSEQSDLSKPYEFGDAFLLDLSRTLMSAIRRGPADGALHLNISDFEVFRTEHVSRAATVLMVDLSRSMPMRGCFTAAKKVALAMNTLIRTQFPRDHLYIIGFSDYARQLRPESLCALSLSEHVHGTNIQHGLLLARRLLARHRNDTRQIILITDGEPTAHVGDNRLHFSYPPSPATIQATLREVQQCTREDIVINTFMLERSLYLAEFVTQMTRINHGRVFFTTPERLGDYVLVDFVHNRRRQVRASAVG